MRASISALVVVGLLSGCSASPQTMATLNEARTSCGAGNLPACNSIPYVEKVADQEARSNTALLLLLPLIPLLIFVHK